MTTKTRPNDEPVRLLFEMTRDDNSRLYDDLIRFNEGTKRVNRLRFLAHEGLLAQHWMVAPVGNGMPGMPIMGSAVPPAPPGVNPVAARHTNHAFAAPPVGEEA